jgi:large subunit ribosomal protein L3
MTIGLVGRKCGMTRVFDDNGNSIPVSVVYVGPNRVTQIKNVKTDGYNAVQLAYGEKKTSKLNKAQIGQFSKAKVKAGEGLIEFRLEKEEELALGNEFTVELFKDQKLVDVTGVSKGKGFAGCVKRHNFAMQDATHGNSLSHRAPGSIGQNQSPGKVFKGKKMSGQMGNKQITTQNLAIVKIDAEKQLVLIKGAIPGAINGVVVVSPAQKAKGDA